MKTILSIKNLYNRCFSDLSKKAFKKLSIMLFFISDLMMVWLLPGLLGNKISSVGFVNFIFARDIDRSTFINNRFYHDLEIILSNTMTISMLAIFVLNIISYFLYMKDRPLAILYLKLLAFFGLIISLFFFIDGIWHQQMVAIFLIIPILFYIYNMMGMKFHKIKAILFIKPKK